MDEITTPATSVERPKTSAGVIWIGVLLTLAALITVLGLVANSEQNYNERVERADKCVADTFAQLDSKYYREPASCR